MKQILFAVALLAALCQAAPARAAERAVEKEVVVPVALAAVWEAFEIPRSAMTLTS